MATQLNHCALKLLVEGTVQGTLGIEGLHNDALAFVQLPLWDDNSVPSDSKTFFQITSNLFLYEGQGTQTSA